VRERAKRYYPTHSQRSMRALESRGSYEQGKSNKLKRGTEMPEGGGRRATMSTERQKKRSERKADAILQAEHV